jgi:endonuclease/exonuclease/phosphatase family metal-dependent hydrolase
MAKNIFRAVSKNMVVAVNLTVALLFTLSCHGRYLFIGGFWPLTLLPIAAPYLLLVLFLFFLTWVFFQSRWLLVFPVIMLINLGYLAHLVPFRFTAPFDQDPPQEALRIMSWNVAQFDILYDNPRPSRRDEMVALVNSFQPDIACFQEMVAGDSPVNLNNPYYRKYRFFPIQGFADELRLPGYHYSYHPGDDFLIQQHFGLAIFSRYPIVNKQKVTLEDGRYNNFFNYCDIVVGKDTLRIFNIHLQSLKFNKSNLRFIDNPTIESSGMAGKTRSILRKFKLAVWKRKKQADRVRQEIENSPYPVIVCGDFNDVPNSYPYQTIGKGLLNGFTEKGAGIGRTFSKIAPTLRIDNIFCSPRFVVQQFTRLDRELSDHFPIVADLKPRKE